MSGHPPTDRAELDAALTETYTAEGVAAWWSNWDNASDERRAEMELSVLLTYWGAL